MSDTPHSVGIGDVLGDFRVIKKLGEGGMGVVYLAEDERLERRVALKVIAPHLARDDDFRKRFTTEAKSAAAIDHPNAVTVYSSGTIDGNLYIAMRYVNGTNLRSALRQSGPLDARAAAAIVTEVGSALDAAHAAGLVHRDVKPENILLEGEPGEGKAYLTDFGLTKGGSGDAGVELTGTGQWVGTIDYVAPEQIKAGKIDARTDVYALGCVLYEVVTGSVPFAGNDMQKMWGHVNEPFPSSSAGQDGEESQLGSVIERATGKDPDDRYPSAGDLARAATAAVHDEEVDVEEASVATGAAAVGMAEVAETRKLPKPESLAPGMAPTVAGRPTLPPRRPPQPPPRREPQPTGSGSGSGSNATRTAAIIGGAVVIAAGLLAAAVVIAGSDSSPNEPTAVSQVSGQDRTSPQPQQQKPDPERKTPEPPSTIPPDGRPCGAGVWARNVTTSCPFALNVAREYRQSGGATAFRAYSPETGITYDLSCSGSAPVTCTGGNNAAVYIDD
ncbi:MAG: serine/threonine protein kinase [Thermoleophilia bacterium]|nr:serine/threonine protein kinase [Thermoleophilia bacterium]